MNAIVVAEEGIAIREVARPRPERSEILVRVRAAGLNRVDLHLASGQSHGKVGGPGTVIGLEWSGEVVEGGADVSGFKPQDPVMCSRKGRYAEYAIADWRRVSRIPANNMSF